MNHTITVDTAKGPMGAGGFRSGEWPITIDGVPYMADVSVSHSLPVPDQAEAVREKVLLYIANNGGDPDGCYLLKRTNKPGPPKLYPHRLQLRYGDVEQDAIDMLTADGKEDTQNLIRRLLREAASI